MSLAEKILPASMLRIFRDFRSSFKDPSPPAVPLTTEAEEPVTQGDDSLDEFQTRQLEALQKMLQDMESSGVAEVKDGTRVFQSSKLNPPDVHR